jgi:hypothetical protein
MLEKFWIFMEGLRVQVVCQSTKSVYVNYLTQILSGGYRLQWPCLTLYEQRLTVQARVLTAR